MENEKQILDTLDEIKNLEIAKKEAEEKLIRLKDDKIKQYQKDRELKIANSKKLITANEARTLAESTAAVRNHIAKFIQEEAKEGRTGFGYCIWGVAEAQIAAISEELVSLGYNVERKTDTDELIIKW